MLKLLRIRAVARASESHAAARPTTGRNQAPDALQFRLETNRSEPMKGCQGKGRSLVLNLALRTGIRQAIVRPFELAELNLNDGT